MRSFAESGQLGHLQVQVLLLFVRAFCPRAQRIEMARAHLAGSSQLVQQSKPLTFALLDQKERF
jgi:hypothetical protein